MPVFHTKTIESILEPVAQQVSRLVILHEEAEDGNAMPDLSRSVAAVKQAVDNLVKIGYETVNTSEDALLKQDMPPALQRVEEAAASLLEASNILRDDPFSAPARKKLINGSRGILQGTSALLLAFDESEVRKIIAQCRRVLDYIGITEVIETMDDLVTFVKNISPGLTRMTKQVDDREKELTHQLHKDILLRCLEQIKVLTPVFISGIKIYIQLLGTGSPSAVEAKENRNHTKRALCDEIQEVIRVLQLTTTDDDDVDTDDAAAIRKALNDMQHRQREATDWLRDTQALPGTNGEKAIHNMLESALMAAGRCADPNDAETICKVVGDVRSMVDALNELRASGQGDSVQAQSLAKGIEEKLAALQSIVAQAISNTEKGGANHAPRTLKGQMEAAQHWLRNPAAFDNGNGERATRAIVADGRRLASTLPPGRARDELLQLCAESEAYVNQLSDLCHRGMGGTPQAKAIARALSDKLNELSDAMTCAVAKKVVDDFLDVRGPLKALSAAAIAPLDTPRREANFNEKAELFKNHSHALSETARQAAVSSGVQSKHSIEAVNEAAKQVTDLAPVVVRSAKVVLMNPGHEAAVEHFNLVKQQWTDNMEKMKALIDENIDTQSFMKATEAAILEDTGHIEEAIVTADSQAIVDNAASIARRSNRILQVAQQEVDNSEDAAFQQEVTAASNKLKTAVPQMVKNAKSLTMNPRSSQHGQNWRRENDSLVDCVREIKIAVAPKLQSFPPPLSPYAALPDMNQLNIDHVKAFPETHSKVRKYSLTSPKLTPPPIGGVARFNYAKSSEEGVPPRPPLPGDEVDHDAPPRPPPPSADPDAEMERVFQQQPKENQPIMMAAHTLHQEVKHWESADNELITAAKHMALLMAKLSSLVRGEGGSKKELIDIARQVAEQSAVVTKLAKGLAAECTDRRMRTSLLQVCERIPTIGTQLKILCTVKATMLGAQGSQEDEEATEMLVGNAQNLMQSVRDTVRAAEGASIKIRVQSGYSIRWLYTQILKWEPLTMSSMLNVLELLDKTQCSYKDLHRSCEMDSIREHIESTIKLARLASEFLSGLDDLYAKFGVDLENLVSTFQQRTRDEILSNSSRHVYDKSTLVPCWEKLMKVVKHDAKRYDHFSTTLKTKSVDKLVCAINYKKSQVAEMCAFRKQLNEMSDRSAADLHSRRVQLRDQSERYEHFRECYTDKSKDKDKLKEYQNCVVAHNEYVIQLISYNKLQKEYHTKSVPMVLQELESIQTEAIVALVDSIESVASLIVNQNQEQVNRYEELANTCKAVSPRNEILKFVRSQNPSSNNYQSSLQSFIPMLTHPHTPAALSKCRVIHLPCSEPEILQKRETLAKCIRDISTLISKKELQLKGAGEAQIRVQGNERSSQLYELQLESCKRRNELNLLALSLAIYRCQESSLSFSSKYEGTDPNKSNSGASSNGSGKSIRAMWKRFAFKAAKAKAAANGSLPTSENSTQSTSSDTPYTESITIESSGGVTNTDPVYALLRCAASIRKSNNMNESMKSKPSLDLSSSSRSSSPTQADYDSNTSRRSRSSQRQSRSKTRRSITVNVASCSPAPSMTRRATLASFGIDQSPLAEAFRTTTSVALSGNNRSCLTGDQDSITGRQGGPLHTNPRYRSEEYARSKSHSFDAQDISVLRTSTNNKIDSHVTFTSNDPSFTGESMTTSRRRLQFHQQGREWPTEIDENPQESEETNLDGQYVILYDFHKREPGNLSLRAGDRVSVVEKSRTGWWLAKFKGQAGYFPERYSLLIKPGQIVKQVARPFHSKQNGEAVHLLRDQVVLQCGPEDEKGMVTVETENIQTGAVQNVQCPLSYLHQM